MWKRLWRGIIKALLLAEKLGFADVAEHLYAARAALQPRLHPNGGEPTAEASYFRCTQCDTAVFTYRGLCAACAPELHAEYEVQATYWLERFARFKTETGIDPLADWFRFEAWCETLEHATPNR